MSRSAHFEELEMRDYYVVQLKMPSGKTMTSQMMLLPDCEALVAEFPALFAVEIIFVCQQ